MKKFWDDFFPFLAPRSPPKTHNFFQKVSKNSKIFSKSVRKLQNFLKNSRKLQNFHKKCPKTPKFSQKVSKNSKNSPKCQKMSKIDQKWIFKTRDFSQHFPCFRNGAGTIFPFFENQKKRCYIYSKIHD